MARVAYVTGAEVEHKSPAFVSAIDGALVVSGAELLDAAVARLDCPPEQLYSGLPPDVPLAGFCHLLQWEMTTRYGYPLSQSQRVLAVGHIFVVRIWRDMLEEVASECYCSLSSSRIFHYEPPEAAEFNAIWQPRLARLTRQVYENWDQLEVDVLSFFK